MYRECLFKKSAGHFLSLQKFGEGLDKSPYLVANHTIAIVLRLITFSLSGKHFRQCRWVVEFHMQHFFGHWKKWTGLVNIIADGNNSIEGDMPDCIDMP